MRILKTVQSYFPFQDRGGPVVKVRALARGLAHRGHQVTVLTADLGIDTGIGSTMKLEPIRWGWRTVEEGVEAIYLPTVAHFRTLTVNPRVVGFCGESLRRFDLVHLYGVYDLLGPVVSYFCRRQGVPYLLEPMGMYRPIVRSLPLKRVYHIWFGNHMVSGARFLIATSEQEKRELVEGGIGESRIVVRRNGIDPPPSLPPRGKFRARLCIPAETKIILFLGRLVTKKSPDLLLQAFAGWRRKVTNGNNAILVLAGPDEGDGYRSKLEALAEKLEVGPSVRFSGPLYDDVKWHAYRDADVFVLPSQNENFGNTAAESAACGTPVIVTDRCGVAPFVGRAGIVIPYDRAALERALDQMLGDPATLERCREGCAEMARSLSWDGPLDECEALYQRCLAEAAA